MNQQADEGLTVTVLRTGRGMVAAVIDHEGPVETSPVAHSDRMKAAIEAREWSEAEGIALSDSVAGMLAALPNT